MPTDDYLERFAWHPEPELIGFRDEAASRESVRRLGEATWAVAVDYLYEQAAKRAMGASHDYETARATFFTDSPGPSPAPRAPSTSAEVLEEFERRLAATQLNAQHPRNFGYFTPPPLLMSIAGELLAQVTNQGVDVWHAGPTGAFVEEEVVRWLADLVGYGPRSFGLLTSGGVMANFTWRARESTPPIKPTSRSRGRSTSLASRPRPWWSSPRTNTFGCANLPSPKRSRATVPRA